MELPTLYGSESMRQQLPEPGLFRHLRVRVGVSSCVQHGLMSPGLSLPPLPLGTSGSLVLPGQAGRTGQADQGLGSGSSE